MLNPNNVGFYGACRACRLRGTVDDAMVCSRYEQPALIHPECPNPCHTIPATIWMSQKFSEGSCVSFLPVVRIHHAHKDFKDTSTGEMGTCLQIVMIGAPATFLESAQRYTGCYIYSAFVSWRVSCQTISKSAHHSSGCSEGATSRHL